MKAFAIANSFKVHEETLFFTINNLSIWPHGHWSSSSQEAVSFFSQTNAGDFIKFMNANPPTSNVLVNGCVVEIDC